MNMLRFNPFARVAIIALLALLVPGSTLPAAVPAPATALPAPASAPDPARVSEALRSAPVMFIENAGQFAEGARFQVRGGNGTLWLAEEAIWITVLEPHPVPPSPLPSPTGRGERGAFREEGGVRGEGRGVHLRLSFPGANPHPRLEPFHRLDTHVSYFLGNDPAKWRADVPVWGGVRYVDLYPGVDLELSGEGGRLVPRLVVRTPTLALPLVAGGGVRLRVEGAEKIDLPSPTGRGAGGEGLLRLTTAVGKYTLPLFQVAGAGGVILPRPSVVGEQVISPFAPSAALNPPSARPNQPADDLLYATFLGGSDSDRGSGIVVDAGGAAYVTGVTSSSNFPTTPGAFDTSYNGSYDAFVVKLNAAGSALAYATFLGGSGVECYWGCNIAVDAGGAAYVTGYTRSSDFPTTPGAFDPSYNGWDDAFVVKLNAAGSALAYATFLGGSGGDVGYGIALDADGAAYISGWTSSSNFPTTPGAFDPSHNGSDDAFVAKLLIRLYLHLPLILRNP